MGRRYNRDTSLKDSLEGMNSTDIDNLIEKEIRFTDLFITVAQDYFLFTAGTFPFSSLLEMVIGRNGYDNYLVDYCLKHNITLVDASHSSRDRVKIIDYQIELLFIHSFNHSPNG